MKLPNRILLSAAMFLMLIGVSVGDINPATHIATEVIQPDKVTRVATALNHITIIELPEPVVSLSIGSDSIRVEYHDNRVLIKPTKPNVSTNLFVWTATSHSVYEILPAGDPTAMSYMLDRVFPVAAASARALSAGGGEADGHHVLERLGEHSPDSERQAAAWSPLLVSPFRRRPLRRVRAVARDARY